MNKSKFLKKSLAMVLAIMMVVAMIPVGASAATAPVIAKVTVGGETATLSGTNYSAEITNPTGAVPVTVQFQNGYGVAYHLDDTNANDADPANEVYKFDFTTKEQANKKASFKVFDSDNQVSGEFTITYTVKPKDGDTSVKSVSYQTDAYGKAVLENDTYTITVPYGTSLSGSTYAKVVLNSDKSGISGLTIDADGTWHVLTGSSFDTKVPFVVMAENNSAQTYYVKIVKAAGFTAFSDKDQVKNEISGVTEDFADTNTVNVYLPYGYTPAETGKYHFTPTFTTGYPSVKVTSLNVKDKTGATTVESGKTVLDLTKTKSTSNPNYTVYADTLTLTYNTLETETWTINYMIPTADEVAAITSLTIGTYTATIDGTNITIELPKGQRNGTDILVGASTGSLVSVVGTAIKGTSASDIATLTSTAKWYADGKNNFTLRVVAAKADSDGVKAKKDYNLTIKTAEPQAAQIAGIILEDASTKKNQYTGAIDQSTGVITFTLPYAIKPYASVTPTSDNSLAGWKLYYTLSSGAEISSGYAEKSGEVLVGNETIFPAGFDGGETLGTAIVVSTPDVNSKQYKIAVKNSAPNADSTISDMKLTTKTKFDDVTDSSSKKVSKSGYSLTASVPFSEYDDYDTASVIATLPEGAKLYYVDSKTSDKLVAVDTMDEAGESVGTALPDITTYKYDGETKTGGKLTPLSLVVASEGCAANLAGTVFNDTFKQKYVGLYSTYSLAVKKEAARTGAAITGFSVYDSISKKTVKAVVDNTNYTIDVKLPYYFDATTSKGQNVGLYLDYTVTGGESVKVGSTALAPLTLKTDGTVDTTTSIAVVADNSAATGALKVGGTTAIATIDVGSEKLNAAGNAPASKHAYTFSVSFEKPKTGALMESVTINGVTARPVGNKITVNLPYASEVTHLVPKFVLSENAYAKNGANFVVEDMAFNFTTDKTFTVYAEDNSNSTTYTVSVTTSDQFTDVKTSDWFYAEVMRAASLGIVGGVGDGRFNPAGNVTRGQFALMVARMEGFKEADYADKTPFSDVKAGTEMAAAIAYCEEKGYIGGYPDTTFKPSKTIKREEMAKIVSVAMGYEEYDAPKAFADDASISSWAKDYVYACVANGMLGGVGNNMYKPQSTTTRAQAATVVVRMYDAK